MAFDEFSVGRRSPARGNLGEVWVEMFLCAKENCMVRLVGQQGTENLRGLVWTIEGHHETNQPVDDGRFVPPAPELVVDAVERLSNGVQPIPSIPVDVDGTSPDQSA